MNNDIYTLAAFHKLPAKAIQHVKNSFSNNFIDTIDEFLYISTSKWSSKIKDLLFENTPIVNLKDKPCIE